MKREYILSSLYRLMLKNVKFFVIIQEWLKRINVPDNTRFNYLELFSNFVKLLLQSVYREHEHGI